MGPLGILLTLLACQLLFNLVSAWFRSRRAPTADPRHPRMAWLAAAIVPAMLAVVVGGTLTFAAPRQDATDYPTRPYLVAAFVGLCALAMTLRLVAVREGVRTDRERRQLAFLQWLLAGSSPFWGAPIANGRMGPSGILLTLFAGWLLVSVVGSWTRGRQTPTADPRHPRVTWLVAAIVPATLAVVVAGVLTFAAPREVPGYDPTGFHLLFAFVGLAALAHALRLGAIRQSLRTEQERDQLVLLAWLLFGIGSCWSIPLLGS